MAVKTYKQLQMCSIGSFTRHLVRGKACQLAFGLSLCLSLVAIGFGVGCGRGRGAEAPGAASAVPTPSYPACDEASKPYQSRERGTKKGIPVWIRRFGCAGDDRVTGVVLTWHGDVIATGQFSGRVSFGGEAVTSLGAMDGFVVKWDEKGNERWAKRFGGINSQAWATGAVLNAGGDVVVAGQFHGVLDAVKPQLLSHGTDRFVLTVKPSGEFGFARAWPHAEALEQRLPMASDYYGGIVVAPGPQNGVVRVGPSGEIAGQISVNQAIVTGLGMYHDRAMVVVGFGDPSSNQTVQPEQELQDPQSSQGISEQPLSGADESSAAAPSTPSSSPPTLSLAMRLAQQGRKAPGVARDSVVFVAKYNGFGQLLWTRTLQAQGGFGPALVAADASGGAVVATTFQGVVDVGTGPLRAGFGYDLLLMRVGPDGATMWARAFDGPQGNEWLRALAVDGVGSVVFGGTFEKAIDLGAGAIMSAGPISGFVARVDPMGHTMWSHVFGGANSSVVVEAVSLGRAGRVVVAGSYRGWTDLGAGWVPGSDQWDGFVAMYAD